MELPRHPLPTGEAQVNGATVPIRALSFAEVRKMRSMGEAERVAWMIACATGVSVEEAAAWEDEASIEHGAALLVAITELSGMEDTVRIGPKAIRARKRTSAS